MKATSLEILTSNNELLVYKCLRGWKRSLVLTVDDGQAKTRVEFPKNQDWLLIRGALARGKGVLKVGMSGLKGLVKENVHYVVTPPAQRRVLISGSGRCGTQAVSHFLDGMQHDDGRFVDARHETLYEFILPMLIKGDIGGITKMLNSMLHEIESAPFYALCPDAIRAELVLHLVRDGRRVVQSGMNRGWYDDDNVWNRIKPVFSQDRFENCCHLWRLTTENMTRHAQHTFRLEDLIASQAERERLLSIIGLKPSGKALPHSNQGKASSDFSQWTQQQKQQFTDICGPMMDLHYPGWRV